MQVGRRAWTIIITGTAFLICLMMALTAYHQSDAVALRKAAKKRNATEEGVEKGQEPELAATGPGTRTPNGGRCPFGFDRPKRLPLEGKKTSASAAKPPPPRDRDSTRQAQPGGAVVARSERHADTPGPRDKRVAATALVAKRRPEIWDDLAHLSSSSEYVVPVKRRKGQRRHSGSSKRPHSSRWIASR